MSWQEEPVAQVDVFKLGETVLKLPLIAAQLGHASLRHTDVYLSPDTPEARFVVDLLALVHGNGDRGIGTEEFCERWFGGMAGARDLFSSMVETAHDRPQIVPDPA